MRRVAIEREAELSPCGRFRFFLLRRWGDGPIVVWLMLNPSTADAEIDDQTVRRICKWAAAWGYDGVAIVNVWPFRTPKPQALFRWLRGLADAPADDTAAIAANLHRIRLAADSAALRMVAFGAEAAAHDRAHLDAALHAFGPGAMCIGTTGQGWPLHPMARGKHRVADTARPIFWTAPEAAHA